MKLILEIEKEPSKDDVLIFDGKKWKPISQNMLFLERDKKIKSLNEELTKFKSDVNAKMKDFHEVLQLLSKKEA